jgi:anti-sigma factor RsiW
MVERICEQLDAYLDGDLASDEHAAFHAHLNQCADCSGAVAFQRRTDQLLAQAVSRPAVDRKLLVRGIDRRVSRARRTRQLCWSGAIAAAASIAVIVSASLWDTKPNGNTVEQPVAVEAHDKPAAFVKARPKAVVTPTDPDETLVVAMPSTNPNVTIVWVYPTFKPQSE